jgi:phage FluMu protein Com
VGEPQPPPQPQHQRRREYHCTQCGELLLRARGQGSELDVEIKCRERQCRAMTTLRPGVPQVITDSMRQRWVQVRRQWRTRRSSNGQVAAPA